MTNIRFLNIIQLKDNMVPVAVLFILPLILCQSYIPSIKPRFTINNKGQLSAFVHDEPDIQQVLVTVIIHGQKHMVSADYIHVNNEWSCTFQNYGLKNQNSIVYIITYIISKTVQKSYEGSFLINGEISSHQLSRGVNVVLYDDFSGNTLDTNKWYHEVTAWGGGNGEFQMYSPEPANTFIKNGVLYLKPTFTVDKFGEKFLRHGTLDVKSQWGICTSDNEGGCHRSGSQNHIPPIMSSKVFSKASIRYGRVEVLARLPEGDWLWPAIWMLPPGYPWKYGGWPQSGEIDIMESRGNMNLKDSSGNIKGVAQVLSTIHYGTSISGHRSHGYWKIAPNGKTWADGFHMYVLDWTKDHIRIEVDGQVIFAWKTPPEGYWKHEGFTGNNIWLKGSHDAPFDGPFHLIMNVAVGGGNYFQDNWNNGADGKPWKANSGSSAIDFWNKRHHWQHTWHGDDVAMKIKSVKMTQY